VRGCFDASAILIMIVAAIFAFKFARYVDHNPAWTGGDSQTSATVTRAP
jgi:hypothetical protein